MPPPGHEPFLRAICANSADDAPRLIYADWLDENGDAERAEFIRLQIQSVIDQDAVDRLDCQLRCEQLFQENWMRWVAGLPGTAALWMERYLEVQDDDSTQIVECDPSIADWDRGFPATVYVQTSSDVFLCCVDEIGEFVPVHRLRMIALSYANVFISMLSLSPFLNKIRELIVPLDIMLQDLPVTALANSPHANQLRQLSLVADLLSDSTGLALVNSPFLSELEMLHLLRNRFSEPVRAALRARFGFRVYC